MLTYLSSNLSEDEYVSQRTKQSRGTGKLTKAALSNAKLFCKDQFNRELIIVLKDIREESQKTQTLETALTFLQKFANWMAIPHLELKMNPNAAGVCAPCRAKDLDSIKGYIIQMRLYMRKVGGIPVGREALTDYKISYPEPQDKEPLKPLLLEEFKIICDAQYDFKRQMLYRIKKGSEARIGAMVQLRKKHFDVSKRPIEIFFPKSIMKKKNGISHANTKYVIKEDEASLLKLLEMCDDEDLVFGTNELVWQAVNNEERAWSRLVCKLGFTERYTHNGKLKTNIHSIKAMTFTAATEAVDETYANAYGDHAMYIKNYYRLTYEEKISKFKLLESRISIYTVIEKISDSKLEKENEELKLKNKLKDKETKKSKSDYVELNIKYDKHDKMLQEICKQKRDETKIPADPATVRIVTKFMQDNNLL